MIIYISFFVLLCALLISSQNTLFVFPGLATVTVNNQEPTLTNAAARAIDVESDPDKPNTCASSTAEVGSNIVINLGAPNSVYIVTIVIRNLVLIKDETVEMLAQSMNGVGTARGTTVAISETKSGGTLCDILPPGSTSAPFVIAKFSKASYKCSYTLGQYIIVTGPAGAKGMFICNTQVLLKNSAPTATTSPMSLENTEPTTTTSPTFTTDGVKILRFDWIVILEFLLAVLMSMIAGC